MVFLPAVFDGLVRNVSLKKERTRGNSGREAAEALVKEAKKNGFLLSSSGSVQSRRTNTISSACSKRGQKGTNQDSFVVWQEYGGQEDMVFCGVFDGHGPWGHHVSKQVRKSIPAHLLCNWQGTLAISSLDADVGVEADPNCLHFDLWKQSYLNTFSAIDQELKRHPRIDSFYSGTTALTVFKQGRHLVIANVGDSRAVLATTAKDGTLRALQLTTDFRPNLPQEVERITRSNGRVFCQSDEPGVYRVWTPSPKSPGLAVSRAFGDYCIKDFGLISVPEISQRIITSRDQFIILATDGLWDVISNQEAVQKVSSSPNKETSAKRLVDAAASAWKCRKSGFARDDISAVCLFFHTPPMEQATALMQFSAVSKAG